MFAVTVLDQRSLSRSTLLNQGSVRNWAALLQPGANATAGNSSRAVKAAPGSAALAGGRHVLALVLDGSQADILRMQELLVRAECTAAAPAG